MQDPSLGIVPSISVIIPTYNHQDYILQTLESVFAQTYRDFEVIVVNDGSPDETDAVVKPLVEDRRIRYIKQKNGGQAAARNTGLRHAKGVFIAFLDDDDLWPADKLEWQIAELQRLGPHVVASAGQCDFIGDEDLSRPEVTLRHPLRLPQLLLANAIVSPGQALIRKSAMEAISGFGNVRGGADDWDCWIRLVKHGEIAVSERTALLYRLHFTNASRNAINMLDSARSVALEHTSKNTDPTRTTVIRSLLQCAGLPVAHQTTRALGRANIGGMIAGLHCLKNCVVAAGWDPECVKIVGLAMLDAFGAAIRAKLRFR